MTTTQISNASSSPSSADIVDDIEKRIGTEIEQLQRDIKRIEPAGADWCTFGDLFVDTDVQQYYEALVNTLKSAKRKGVVFFKGQFLLKGMHDDVIVRIVNKDSNHPVCKNEISSPETDLIPKFTYERKTKQSQPKESFADDSHVNEVKKFSTKNKSYPKHHNFNRSPNQGTMYKSSSFYKSKHGSNNNLQLIQEQDEQVHSTITSPKSTEFSTPQRSDDDMSSPPSILYYNQYQSGERNALSTAKHHQKTNSRQKNNSSQAKQKKSIESTSSKVEFVGTRLDNFLLEKPSKSGKQSEGGDSESVVSYATAPVISMNRSPNSVNISRAQNRDVVHFSVAGTAFNSGNNSESHVERLDRECKQLVQDIRRIEPENEAFCKFGMLFDDPQVEQYYEALVGTLKAARRKGIISFKGQILLKGMHDNVQISIVE